MGYLISDLKDDLTAVLHGGSLDQVANVDGLIYRAARQLLLDLDPMETKRSVLMTSPIYSQVYDYALPTDLKGNKIIDIYPNGFRQTTDRYTQRFNQEFDIHKNLRYPAEFSIIHNTGVKTIRINNISLPEGIVLDSCDSENDWTAGSNASNIQQDTVAFAEGSASISFDLASGANPTTASVSKTLPTGLDMTDHKNLSSIFFWLYFPTASDITSVELRWGSSASAYYSRSATTKFDGTAFTTGWNLIKVNWLGATQVGTPDVTEIDYVYVSITYNGNAQTAVRLDNIVSNLGQMMNIEYYSKYMFQDASTLAFQEKVTSDTNLINLDTESYDILFNQVGFLTSQQTQGMDALIYDSNFFDMKYREGLAKYKAMYKSEVSKPSSVYYQLKKPGFGKYLARRFF